VIIKCRDCVEGFGVSAFLVPEEPRGSDLYECCHGCLLSQLSVLSWGVEIGREEDLGKQVVRRGC
jgi:hypothetical protein